VRVPAGFEPRPEFTWEQLNAEHVFEMRWWTLGEVESTSAVLAPGALARLFREYLETGPPTEPIDIDV